LAFYFFVFGTSLRRNALPHRNGDQQIDTHERRVRMEGKAVRHWIFASAVAVMFGGAMFAGPAAAVPAGALSTLPPLSDVQQAQFFFGGQNYCWYDSGWRGPGFYWCGYAWRRGYGWGGGYGWHGWRGGHGGHGNVRGGYHGRGGNVAVHGGGGRAGIRAGGGARAAAHAGGGGHRGGGGHGGGHGGHHR
jgi:hypothetical protein